MTEEQKARLSELRTGDPADLTEEERKELEKLEAEEAKEEKPEPKV